MTLEVFAITHGHSKRDFLKIVKKQHKQCFVTNKIFKFFKYLFCTWPLAVQHSPHISHNFDCVVLLYELKVFYVLLISQSWHAKLCVMKKYQHMIFLFIKFENYNLNIFFNDLFCRFDQPADFVWAAEQTSCRTDILQNRHLAEQFCWGPLIKIVSMCNF